MGSPIAPGPFTEQLFPALRQASAIARALEGRVENVPKRGERRAAKAALTLADTATQESLLVPLHEHYPGVSIEAEEATPTAALFPRAGPAHVVVDPIDGTLHSYLGGRGWYAVMLGLAVERRYRAALLALPHEGILFATVAGGGTRAASGDGELEPIARAEAGDRVLVSHELPDAVRDRLVARGLRPVPASGGAIAVAPLVPGVRGGLRFTPATGSISVRGRIGVLVAREAGARAAGESGAPFADDLDTPESALAVAWDDDTLEVLLSALR